jgi:hypothetical protein
VLPVADPHYWKNQLVGVKERIFRRPPSITKDVSSEFVTFVERWLDKHVGNVYLNPDFDSWIANAPYTLVRKEQLRVEYERGMLPMSWSKVKSFIKREFYLEFKDPRTINSRVDNYKVFAGPWISAIEHWVVENLHSFVKGLTIQQRGERAAQRMAGFVQMYNSDFSRFESQMTPFVIRKIECQLYRRFGMPELLLKPLYGVNKCSMTSVSYRLRATRMSGDMNTSLGNGFVNLMVNKFVAHRIGCKIHGVVEGDDGLFGVSGPLPTSKDFESVGFKAEVVGISDIAQASFCSTRLNILKDGSLWSHTDPRRVLLKAGWSFVCPANASPSFRASLMSAKAMSIAETNSRTPLLMAYAAKYFGLARYHKDDVHYTCGDKYWSVKQFKSVNQPTDEIRQVFAAQYGISVEQQLELENYIATHNDLDHPLLGQFLGEYSQSAFDFAHRYMD